MPIIAASESLSISDRAAAYLAATPPAVSGGHGYSQTGAAVWAVVCFFGLSGQDAFEVLSEYNATCSPPWPERQLRKNIERAERRAQGHPDFGKLLASGKDRRQQQLRQLTSLLPDEQETGPSDVEWNYCLEPRLAGSPGADYLAGRGIPLAAAIEAGVMFHEGLSYSPLQADGSRSVRAGRPAVLFPLQDQSGAVCAAECRHTDGQTPKTTSAGNKRAGVFCTAGALHADPVFIVEGPIDALALADSGFPAVALCGSSSFPSWLPRVLAWRRVAVALDNDTAGNAGAAKVAAALTAYGAKVQRMKPEPVNDWADWLESYGPETLRMALQAALRQVWPEVNTPAPTWPQDVQQWITWFLLNRPHLPAELRTARGYIADPPAWYARLNQLIQEGPAGQHAERILPALQELGCLVFPDQGQAAEEAA